MKPGVSQHHQFVFTLQTIYVSISSHEHSTSAVRQSSTLCQKWKEKQLKADHGCQSFSVDTVAPSLFYFICAAAYCELSPKLVRDGCHRNTGGGCIAIENRILSGSIGSFIGASTAVTMQFVFSEMPNRKMQHFPDVHWWRSASEWWMSSLHDVICPVDGVGTNAGAPGALYGAASRGLNGMMMDGGDHSFSTHQTQSESIYIFSFSLSLSLSLSPTDRHNAGSKARVDHLYGLQSHWRRQEGRK